MVILAIFTLKKIVIDFSYHNSSSFMAEQERFELSLGYSPTDGFQDHSLQPLGYCSRKEKNLTFAVRFSFALNGGHYRARTCDLPHVKRMLSQLS